MGLIFLTHGEKFYCNIRRIKPGIIIQNRPLVKVFAAVFWILRSLFYLILFSIQQGLTDPQVGVADFHGQVSGQVVH